MMLGYIIEKISKKTTKLDELDVPKIVDSIYDEFEG